MASLEALATFRVFMKKYVTFFIRKVFIKKKIRYKFCRRKTWVWIRISKLSESEFEGTEHESETLLTVKYTTCFRYLPILYRITVKLTKQRRPKNSSKK